MKKRKKVGFTYLPALRCKMGDRGYFVTAMQLREIADRVKDVAEVHSSEKLRDWIQRQLKEEHAQDIAQYLMTEESRFFNAIVVGVYGGDVQWGPLKVADPREELSDADEKRIDETLGILTLTGQEQLFPIDGQHRVAGIKKAVLQKPELGEEEVTVILIGHGRTDVGKKRTRRLFVTLNQRAKQVSPRDIVALDEDNGLAVITRQMVDEYPLFQKAGIISFSANVSISDKDTSAITSVLGLYQIVKGLYPRTHEEWPKLKNVQRNRPNGYIDDMYIYFTSYWDTLVKTVPEYKTVFKDEKRQAAHYRQPKMNHLLFRPVGQLAFARAVEYLVSRNYSLKDAVDAIHSNNEMYLQNATWHHILWDPVAKKMLNNWSPAEALLVTSVGEEPRSKAAADRLRKLQSGGAE